MLRDAEKQFLSALKTADMVTTVLELSKVGFDAIHRGDACAFALDMALGSWVHVGFDALQLPFIPQSLGKPCAH